MTWVAWIEQGRAVRASADTLARLADALNLTRAERAYLFALAERHDPVDPFSQVSADAPPAIAALAGQLDWPAYGLDSAWTVCCANPAARRLFVGLFDDEDRPNPRSAASSRRHLGVVPMATNPPSHRRHLPPQKTVKSATVVLDR